LYYYRKYLPEVYCSASGTGNLLLIGIIKGFIKVKQFAVIILNFESAWA